MCPSSWKLYVDDFPFFWFLSSLSRTRARAVWSLGDKRATNHHHRQWHQLPNFHITIFIRKITTNITIFTINIAISIIRRLSKLTRMITATACLALASSLSQGTLHSTIDCCARCTTIFYKEYNTGLGHLSVWDFRLPPYPQISFSALFARKSNSTNGTKKIISA